MEFLLYLSSKIEPVFYQILYMSIIASVIGITIFIVTKTLKNKISSKWISVIWLTFIVSLCIPPFIKSDFSIYNLFPDEFVSNIKDVNYSENSFRYGDLLDGYEEILDESLEFAEMDLKDLETKTEVEFENLEQAQDNIKEKDVLKVRQDISKQRKEFFGNVFLKYLPVIWAFISIILFILYILTYIVFEMKIRKSEIQDVNLKVILEKCKTRLKVKKNIKIIKQDFINMPSIFGIFNIRILVNDELLKLSDKQMEYVFMHELAHYKRKDNLLNILITIFRCIYFFNPVVFLLLTQVKKDLELATDELAIGFKEKEEQKEYSKTLVMLSSLENDRFLVQTLCLSDEKKNLERRIEKIKLLDKFKKHKNVIAVISIVLIALILSVLFTRNSDYFSKNDLLRLVKKNQNTYDNFKLEVINEIYYDKDGEACRNKTKSETYRKGNSQISISDTLDEEYGYKSIFYTNIDTKENISINESESGKNIYYNKYNQEPLEDLENLMFKSFLDGKYEYLGQKKINEKDVYVIQIENAELSYDYKTNVLYKYKDIYYIEKDTGILLRFERKYDEKPEGFGDITTDFNYTLDVVTDEEVAKPDIYEYKDARIDYSFLDALVVQDLISENKENSEEIINNYKNIDREKYKYKFNHKLYLINDKYVYDVSFNNYGTGEYYKFILDFDTNKVISYETVLLNENGEKTTNKIDY